MKYLRWTLGLLVGLYALSSLFPLGMTVLYKLGRLTEVPADAQRYVPLMEATAWPHAVLWAMVLVFYFVTALRLLRGSKALMVYAGAFLLDVVSLVLMRADGVYAQVFTPQELAMDYYIVAALVAVGALIWWTERDRSPSATAAA